MFTGIVQNQARVLNKVKRGGMIRFTFRLQRKEWNLKVGESVSVNGVCLTATNVGPKSFQADVIGETLESTTLGGLKKGDIANIERSLKVGDPISGHFVTGHVDGRGEIKKVERSGKNRLISIRAVSVIMKQLAKKGSIAVDGVSLTIQHIKNGTFQAALVPHTMRTTTLGALRAGDSVNLEIDLIFRYLNLLSGSARNKRRKKLTSFFLKKQGF